MSRHRADTGPLYIVQAAAAATLPTAIPVAAALTVGGLGALALAGPASAYVDNGDGTVTVQRGDTVSEIAVRTGHGTTATLAANGLSASSLIFPGDHLTLAGTHGVAAPAPVPDAAATLDADAATIVAAARAQIGVPYVYGGEGLIDGGFDCSGLTQYAARAAGISIPRTSTAQKRVGYAVSDPRPGDLVTFDGLTHVAIYVGNGRIIDAPKPGRTIQERDLWTSNVTYRRIV